MRLFIALGSLMLTPILVILIYLGIQEGMVALWGYLGLILPPGFYSAESVIIFLLLCDRINGNPIRFIREAMRYERRRDVK